MKVIIFLLLILNIGNFTAQNSDNQLFKKDVFKCICEKTRNKLFIENFDVNDSSRMFILKNRTNVLTDTITYSWNKDSLLFLIDDLGSYVININSELGKYQKLGENFGFGNYVFTFVDTLITNKNYWMSLIFTCEIIDCNIIYQLDFDTEKQIYQINYLHKSKAYRCR
jgi:hypothetical protein